MIKLHWIDGILILFGDDDLKYIMNSRNIKKTQLQNT